VDRAANMRSFIEKMCPKTADKALPGSPLFLNPCEESEVEESAKREPDADWSQGPQQTLSKRRRKTPIADSDTKQLSTLKGNCLDDAITVMSGDEVETNSSILGVSARCRKRVSQGAPSSSVSRCGGGGDDHRDGWACATCTYSHRAQERQYLLCAMCGSNRLAAPSL
jgi:hypothetical protein